MSNIFSKKFEELLSDSPTIKSLKDKLPQEGLSESEQIAALQARITSLENNVLTVINTCRSIMETCSQLNKVYMIHRKSIEEIYDFLSNPDNFSGVPHEEDKDSIPEEKQISAEQVEDYKKTLN
jgi:hypothetical protein